MYRFMVVSFIGIGFGDGELECSRNQGKPDGIKGR
jgi:hypothetical protein